MRRGGVRVVGGEEGEVGRVGHGGLRGERLFRRVVYNIVDD